MERRPPKVLADYAWYQDGVGLLGLVSKVKLPALNRAVEEYIAGGMAGSIKIDMAAVEPEDIEITIAELNAETIAMYGLTNGFEKPFVFRSALQGQNGVESFTVKATGRVYGLDMGEIERKKLSEMNCKITWNTYTILSNGVELVHIDILGGIERVGGVDLRAGINKALGI
ncbi:phage major tail tube protein [Vibrio plantisponsor]|uniref:Phage major tail tube protein n=1 Tax=Vibrio plantisponsor TaxID=664643 RepID=A0ABU4IHE2_9VIBR|nr:phage major tail tube protein [Vibrio plantisponsor]MBY7811408.1 phage major tail tube protein [Vibrio fluvialis]MBY8161393.1 phage major tail tube protein [Vibrio fluvialis]MDW6017634.1 phage major tail tube protein [Vibrio plantisponsor]NNM40469.1 phage major tail tube protein [Vibrio plantisponsor]